MNPFELLVGVISGLTVLTLTVIIVKNLIIIKDESINRLIAESIVSIHSAGIRSKSAFNVSYDLKKNREVIITSSNITINNVTINYKGLEPFNNTCSKVIISNEAVKC